MPGNSFCVHRKSAEKRETFAALFFCQNAASDIPGLTTRMCAANLKVVLLHLFFNNQVAMVLFLQVHCKKCVFFAEKLWMIALFNARIFPNNDLEKPKRR